MVKNSDKNNGNKEDQSLNLEENVGISLEREEAKKQEGVKEQEEVKKEEGVKKQSGEDEELKGRISELESQYLRVLADYQNLQKRTAQEKEELYKYAGQKTIEILLPALDVFDYARGTLKPDSKVEKIIEDFNLVFEMLIKCLKDIGLEVIDETGVPFDPQYHEPLHQIPTNELPDHTVMQVLKKGYILNKRVIRPALVTVSINEENKEEK